MTLCFDHSFLLFLSICSHSLSWKLSSTSWNLSKHPTPPFQGHYPSSSCLHLLDVGLHNPFTSLLLSPPNHLWHWNTRHRLKTRLSSLPYLNSYRVFLMKIRTKTSLETSELCNILPHLPFQLSFFIVLQPPEPPFWLSSAASAFMPPGSHICCSFWLDCSQFLPLTPS